MSGPRPNPRLPLTTRFRLIAHVAAVCGSVSMIWGCSTYTIEYRQRPAYYEKMSDGPLPSEVTLDDGTRIVYRNIHGTPFTPTSDGGTPLKTREELDDGTILLRAWTPTQVLSHALVCVQKGEYELMWDQVIAEDMRQMFLAEGLDSTDFAEMVIQNRKDVATMLRRMILGISGTGVSSNDLPNGVVRLTFWPQVGYRSDGRPMFKWQNIDVVREGMYLKLQRFPLIAPPVHDPPPQA